MLQHSRYSLCKLVDHYRYCVESPGLYATLPHRCEPAFWKEEYSRCSTKSKPRAPATTPKPPAAAAAYAVVPMVMAPPCSPRPHAATAKLSTATAKLADVAGCSEDFSPPHASGAEASCRKGFVPLLQPPDALQCLLQPPSNTDMHLQLPPSSQHLAARRHLRTPSSLRTKQHTRRISGSAETSSLHAGDKLQCQASV